MHPEGLGAALRAARLALRWSQSDAARELARLGGSRGITTASAASLKTQLSRWENDHVAPEPVYRALLADLFDRPELAVPPDDVPAEPARPPAGEPSPAQRLRARVGAAREVDDAALALLESQLRAGRALDDRLGAAGAGGLIGAQLEQLTELVAHTLDPRRRFRVAALAAEAGVLGGWQALDQDRPDLAYARHDRARGPAQEAGDLRLLGEALAGQSVALLAAGLDDDALAVLDAAPATGPAAAWPAAARGVVHATRGEPGPAERAFEEALDQAHQEAGAGEPRQGGVEGDRPWGGPPMPSPAAASGAGRPHPVVDIAQPPTRVRIDLGAMHRLRDVTLAPYQDDALHALREALAGPQLAVRERAGLHAGLALALAARGERGEVVAEQADAAADLADRIGSYRIRRLLEEGLRPRLSVRAPR